MTATLVHLDLEPLGPHFGAVVHHLDLAAATDGEIAAIRATLVERKVLFSATKRSTTASPTCGTPT
jgi:hypothetical protein